MRVKVRLVVFSLIAILMSGCDLASTQRKYDATIESGMNGQGYAGKFNKLYPGANNVISYFTGAAGSPAWTSSIGLYDRYVFRVHFDIQLDSSHSKITSEGSPTFFLYELYDFKPRANGGLAVGCKQIATFGPEKWGALISAGGNFDAIGIPLRTNDPVSGFAMNWKRF